MQTYNRLLEIRARRGAGYIVLIDPDKLSLQESVKLAMRAEQEDADIIFIGGSLLSTPIFDELVRQVKAAVKIPVIIFPGGVQQISRHADAILFMSVISGRNPDLLIGQHVMGAPIVKMLNLEAIATGYMLIESGKMTSAEFMSNTKPIPRDKPQIAVAHALAAEYLGMKLIYLEAGSGALQPVPDEMIQAVAAGCSLPIIVGGGIRTPEVAQQKAKAGASFIVTGNVLEKKTKEGLIREFAGAIHQEKFAQSIN
ncbi:MAG: geranylgeranylglyceryl/heptaprenylglyceryl phosphate synthase [candidate division KSB1 bacterium]|nr:geranylgeranylglyceryl/heptaprenylglyceryl phosphate synthase [candidate division KSB1 bacterium]MDZ7358835.1 geranylgeranylglyceryl/heptaprenylglyceryl phosphate synthase [candidate division KSB1 bacterium]MDZ7399749.1 geranylgeranylglyceryl/heptaprenylglyceryl phosphate synthase [candidate division KSB1 bacterium]